jgi:hypothetical protein
VVSLRQDAAKKERKDSISKEKVRGRGVLSVSAKYHVLYCTCTSTLEYVREVQASGQTFFNQVEFDAKSLLLIDTVRTRVENSAEKNCRLHVGPVLE